MLAAAAIAAQPHSEPAAPALELGERKSFLAVAGESVLLSACKRAATPDEAEGGDPSGRLALRLYNPMRQSQAARIRLHGGISRAWYASILEVAREEVPLDDGAIALTLPAGKIVTLLVESPLRPPASPVSGGMGELNRMG